MERTYSKHAAIRLTISYFTLHSPGEAPLFRRLHNSMRQDQLAGMSLMPNEDVLLMVPNGELSSLMSLPSYDFPAFHCLFVKYTNEAVMEYSVEQMAGQEK